MTRNFPVQHLDDGDLVRLLADETSSEEHAHAEAHLASCAPCAQRLEEYRAVLGDVSDLLASTPVPALDAERRARSLEAVRQAAWQSGRRSARRRRFVPSGALARAAAVASLLFATAVVATPVGSWVAGAWNGIFGTDTPTAAGSTPVSTPARSSVVAFRPTGRTLDIELLHPQRSGTLTLRVADTATASLRVSGGEGDAGVVVLPASVRIDNGPSSVTDYVVTIPLRLDRVVVRLGDGDEIVLEPGELGASWSTTLDLGQRAGRSR